MSLTELTGNPRHDQLLTLIADRGYMNIDELAQLLDVSTQTVRRDIRKLSEQGLITRHHGGAGRASSVVNTAFEQREVSLTEEKRAIAEAIADYIPDGSTIFITIGTTVEHVARALLNHNHLRIITNSLRVAHILYKNPRFEVMVPGGTLRPLRGVTEEFTLPASSWSMYRHKGDWYAYPSRASFVPGPVANDRLYATRDNGSGGVIAKQVGAIGGELPLAFSRVVARPAVSATGAAACASCACCHTACRRRSAALVWRWPACRWRPC